MELDADKVEEELHVPGDSTVSLDYTYVSHLLCKHANRDSASSGDLALAAEQVADRRRSL